MPQEKQSFILYADAREHTGMMTDNQLGHLFRLLMDFVADGTAPTAAEIGDGMVAMAFSFLSAQIARDKKKYQETCEKRRQAGRKAGLISAARRAEAKQAAALSANVDDAQRFQHEHDPDPDPDPEPEYDPDPHPDPESEPEHDPHPDPLPVPGAAAAPAAEPAGGGTMKRMTAENIAEETAGDGMMKRTMTPGIFPGERTKERTGITPAGQARGQTQPRGEPLAALGSCLPALGAAANTPEALWVGLGLGQGALPALAQLLAESRARGIEEEVLAEAIRRTAEHQPKAPLAYLRSSLEQCAARGCKTLPQFLAAYSGSGRGMRVDRPAPSGKNFLADAVFRTGEIRKKRRDDF